MKRVSSLKASLRHLYLLSIVALVVAMLPVVPLGAMSGVDGVAATVAPEKGVAEQPVSVVAPRPSLPPHRTSPPLPTPPPFLMERARQPFFPPPATESGARPPRSQPTPYAIVHETGDRVWGYSVPSDAITVTVKDAGGVPKGTATGTADDTGWYDISTYPTDIVPGDIVDVVLDGRLNTIDVVAITVSVDVDADTISGTAPPNSFLSSVNIGRYGEGYGTSTYTDEAGNFFVDLSGLWDIRPGDGGNVHYQNPEGNQVQHSFTAPYVRVNEGHNWVQGYVSPYATVAITLTTDGDVKGIGSATTGGSGWFNTNIYSYTQWVDIVPGDRVEVAASDGFTALVDVVSVTGQVDATANTVWGNVSGPGVAYPADVRAEVWVKDGPPSQEGLTDNVGDYFFDFSPFDLKPGHSVAVWYINSEGNWVGNVFVALFVRVYPTDDHLWGQTSPNITVTVSLWDSEGHLKGTAQTVSDENGNWWTNIYTDGQWVEIDDHDTVEVVAGINTASVYVPMIVALPDAVDDLMFIVSELPNEGLDVRWSSAPGAYDLAYGTSVTTDETGNARVDFGPLGGLELGVNGNIYYYNADGHSIEPWWRAMLSEVVPDLIVNNRENTIVIFGTDFQDGGQRWVGLGILGGPPTIYVPGHYISSNVLTATLPVGIPAGNYFIQVSNPDERYGFLQRAISVVGPTPTEIPINAGWTLIGPCPPYCGYTASTLAQAMIDQGLQVEEVARWYGGTWESYLVEFPIIDFDIEPNVGYFVRSSNSGVWTPGP